MKTIVTTTTTLTAGLPASKNTNGPILLTAAAQFTGVSYHTLIEAINTGKLAAERAPDIHNDSISVQVYKLVKFMISHAPDKNRWKPTQMHMNKIVMDARLQPRKKHDAKFISKIADDLRRGDNTPPIWVIKAADGNYLIIDGHRRYAAHKLCCRDAILAIVIEIPVDYAIALSRTANLEHAENLTTHDQLQIIEQHFHQNPTLMSELENGTLSQAEIARRLQVLEVYIGRYLAKISPKPKVFLPAAKLLREVLPIFKHLGHAEPKDALCIALVLQKISAAIVNSWDPIVRKDILRIIQLNSSPIVRSLSPELRKLFDRRGGDRRKKQPQQN